MLLNGIFYNSEAWHGITKKQTKILESIDEDLLRRILKLHSKTPKEFLYLETGSTPIKWVLKQRRINYLKHILSLEENEIVKKVFTAQKENPTSGDFVQLVEKDLMDLSITQAHLELHGKSDFKKLLKNIVTKEAFKELLELKEKHTKVKHIEYDALKIQNYLQSPNICTEETQVLASLRSNCIKTVRKNFPKLYKNRLYCPLKCEEQNQIEDTQKHLLTCKKLNKSDIDNVRISDAYACIAKQEAIAKLISKVMRKRSTMLEQIEEKEKHSFSN